MDNVTEQRQQQEIDTYEKINEEIHKRFGYATDGFKINPPMITIYGYISRLKALRLLEPQNHEIIDLLLPKFENLQVINFYLIM